MDFKRISHFVAVAEAKSLTKAADRLHIVQPAISQSIKKLEEEMGVELFVRSRRGMELSNAGRVFLKSAYGILNQFNRAKEDVATLVSNPKGVVSVAMTASALNVLSSPVVELLCAEYPDIQLNLEEGLTGNIQTGLEAGWYDLVIISGSSPDESVHVEDLVIEDLYFVTPYTPRHPKKIRFAQIQMDRLIIPKDQDSISNTLKEYARDDNLAMPRAQITAALHPALLLVEAGLGNTIMPWSAIHDRVNEKRLSAYRIHSPSPKRRVSMIYPTQKPISQASIAVMEVIRLAVKKVHGDGHWHGQLLS